MKIQFKDETIPLTKVAELPVAMEGDGDTADEILDSLPDSPVCVKCKRVRAEANADGFCNVCQPTLPKNGFMTPAESDATATPSRPSLLVEMDVNSNLKPRIFAHIGRMRAWDLRKLDVELRSTFAASLDVLSSAFGALEEQLMRLTQAGFVAKTTPVTRIAAKLVVGSRVNLREDQRVTFAACYSAEQLDSLTVVRTTDTHVQLQAADGSNIGLVKIIHVELKS